YFLEIEAQGGYSAYVASGELERKVSKTREARFAEVAHNKKSLIGTNVYADLSTPIAKDVDPIEIPHRLAKPYEELRTYFEDKQPKVVLLTFGELKDFKPRADFVKGFLATGGIDVEYSPAFKTAEEGQEWIKENEKNVNNWKGSDITDFLYRGKNQNEKIKEIQQNGEEVVSHE